MNDREFDEVLSKVQRDLETAVERIKGRFTQILKKTSQIPRSDNERSTDQAEA